MNSNLSGPLLILASAVFFSVTGTLQALAPDGATPWAVAAVRVLASTLVLFLWCALSGRLPRISRNLPWRSILVCAVCTSFYQVFFFAGTQKLGVAVGTVVCVGATPVMAAIVGMVFRKRFPRPMWYAATAVAVLGIALLNVQSFEAGNLGWIVLPLLGALVYGVYMNASPGISSRMNPEAGIMLSLALVSLFLSPALFLYPVDWVWNSSRGLLVTAAFGLAGGLGFGLFFLGMKHTTPVVSATLSLAEPMGAACWGIFLLGEDKSLPTVAGILIILAAIGILIWDGARQGKAAEEKPAKRQAAIRLKPEGAA